MSLLHDDKNRITAVMYTNLEDNIETIGALFKDCADVVKRKMTVGGTNKIDIYFVYRKNLSS